MDRQQILDLYDWSTGVCFRHPCKGAMPTTVLTVLRPPHDGEREVRACADCVIALEDARRESACREGVEYEAGHIGSPLRYPRKRR